MSQTHRFELKADPRVVADGHTPQDFADQLALSIQVRDALSEARMAVSRIDGHLAFQQLNCVVR